MHRIHHGSRIAFVIVLLLSLAPLPAKGAIGRTEGASDVSVTGEATYSIPVFAPDGVKKLTPALALTYGHRQDEGLAGVGWSISGLSEITRCAKT